MRVAWRGDRSHVSLFHRRRSRSFWGALFCCLVSLSVFVCLLVCVCLFVCLFVCLVCFPRSRDQSSSLAKLNDRLSCHGAHGMGEKN